MLAAVELAAQSSVAKGPPVAKIYPQHMTAWLEVGDILPPSFRSKSQGYFNFP